MEHTHELKNYVEYPIVKYPVHVKNEVLLHINCRASGKIVSNSQFLTFETDIHFLISHGSRDYGFP